MLDPARRRRRASAAGRVSVLPVEPFRQRLELGQRQAHRSVIGLRQRNGLSPSRFASRRRPMPFHQTSLTRSTRLAPKTSNTGRPEAAPSPAPLAIHAVPAIPRLPPGQNLAFPLRRRQSA